MFLAAILLRSAGPYVGGGLQRTLHEALSGLRGESLGFAESAVWGRWMASNALLLTGGAVVLVLSAGLLASGLQVGFRITPQALSIKWERLSFSNGWNRLASMDGFVRGLSLLVKFLLVMTIAGFLLAGRWDEWRGLVRGTLHDSIGQAWDAVAAVAIAVSFGGLAWAAADYLYRWWRHEQQLRMTRQELKDEIKRDEGDQQLRGRIRNAQKQATVRKSLQAVPEASIVITNPTHFAVALKYELGQSGAPRVVAKGKGALALRIRQIALDHGVPVHEAKPLARALYRQVPIGGEIPFELFHIVAEILSRLYRRKQAG